MFIAFIFVQISNDVFWHSLKLTIETGGEIPCPIAFRTLAQLGWLMKINCPT
jgi:pyruvate/2-oxoglutarate/acetoin dehydrogenase E1 component